MISCFFAVLRHLCQIELQLRETIPLAGAQAGWRSQPGVRRHASPAAARGQDGQGLAGADRAGLAGGSGDRPARRGRGPISLFIVNWEIWPACRTHNTTHTTIT